MNDTFSQSPINDAATFHLDMTSPRIPDPAFNHKLHSDFEQIAALFEGLQNHSTCFQPFAGCQTS